MNEKHKYKMIGKHLIFKENDSYIEALCGKTLKNTKKYHYRVYPECFLCRVIKYKKTKRWREFIHNNKER